MNVQTVHFDGPFSWHGKNQTRTVLEGPSTTDGGIYLWTVLTPMGELIYYVGDTERSFATRMREHLKEHLAGAYHVFDPDEFAKGVKVERWPGLYDPDRRPSVQEWLEKYESLASPIARLVGIYRFYLGAMEGEKRMRRRIEAALSDHLRNQPGEVGAFQEKGVRYERRWPSEVPTQVCLTSVLPLLGLPRILDV